MSRSGKWWLQALVTAALLVVSSTAVAQTSEFVKRALERPAEAVETAGTADLSAESIERRIANTGWLVANRPVTQSEPLRSSWLWIVTKGDVGGAVALYHHKNTRAATLTQKGFRRNPDAATFLVGNTLISAVVAGEPKLARDLIETLMKTGMGTPHGGGSAARAVFGSPKGADSSDHNLPNVHLGRIPRARLVAMVLETGWTLNDRPTATSAPEYDVVTYSLERKGKKSLLSLYECRKASCVKSLRNLAKRSSRGHKLVHKQSMLLWVGASPKEWRALSRTISQRR